MSVTSHRSTGPASICCAVVTVSDTRTLDTDMSGRALVELLTGAGHGIASRVLVQDEPRQVTAAIRAELARESVQAIITTGGTGISARDSTYESVVGLFEKTLDGFGEIFRMLSYEEIGSAAMLSRACAGVSAGRIIFLLPGSAAAVRLAVRRLILPELTHLVGELSKDRDQVRT
jgi:molybdenum cofactor biosynthesis protein B